VADVFNELRVLNYLLTYLLISYMPLRLSLFGDSFLKTLFSASATDVAEPALIVRVLIGSGPL